MNLVERGWFLTKKSGFRVSFLSAAQRHPFSHHSESSDRDCEKKVSNSNASDPIVCGPLMSETEGLEFNM